MAQEKTSRRKPGMVILPFTKRLVINSGVWLGHLNTVLPEGVNLNEPVFKSSKARGLPELIET